jgi:pimeloyl-ACP methyl ester carboxylesterase
MSIAGNLTHFVFNLQRKRAGLTRKEIQIPDGLRYVYLEGGHGEPLLLLHGFGANKDNFTQIARYLTPHFRVIAPDHIDAGHAPSGIHADARHRSLPSRGHSMGGQISLIFTSLYPNDVQSLWLIDPGGY